MRLLTTYTQNLGLGAPTEAVHVRVFGIWKQSSTKPPGNSCMESQMVTLSLDKNISFWRTVLGNQHTALGDGHTMVGNQLLGTLYTPMVNIVRTVGRRLDTLYSEWMTPGGLSLVVRALLACIELGGLPQPWCLPLLNANEQPLHSMWASFTTTTHCHPMCLYGWG